MVVLAIRRFHQGNSPTVMIHKDVPIGTQARDLATAVEQGGMLIGGVHPPGILVVPEFMAARRREPEVAWRINQVMFRQKRNLGVERLESREDLFEHLSL